MSAPNNYAIFRITIDDGGTVREIIRKMDAWALSSADLSSAFELIGQRLLKDNMTNVVGQGALYTAGRGTAWAPLASSTIADRIRKKFGAGPTMWRTGRLARSLSERGAEGNVFEVTPTSVTVGTDVEYAGYQHWGTSRIPARRLVGVSWDTQQYMVRVIGDTIREKARAAGFETTD